MKKFLSLLLAAMLLISLSAAAFAADDNTSSLINEEYLNPSHIHVPTSWQYAPCNNYTHYVQVKCSCGEVLWEYTDSHALDAGLHCSKCGWSAQQAIEDVQPGHIHTYDHEKYSSLNAYNHRIEVICSCGEVIGTDSKAHSFNSDGVCSLCGYSKNGSGENGSGENGNGENGSGGSGDNGSGNNGSGDNGNNGSGSKGNGGSSYVNPYDDHAYEIITTPCSYEEAKAAAAKAGAHLVTIESLLEQKLVEKLNPDKLDLLTGAYVKDSGEWAWVTDEIWDYTNWNKNEPSMSTPGMVGVLSPDKWSVVAQEDVEALDGFILEWDDKDDYQSVILDEKAPAVKAEAAPEAEPLSAEITDSAPAVIAPAKPVSGSSTIGWSIVGSIAILSAVVIVAVKLFEKKKI